MYQNRRMGLINLLTLTVFTVLVNLLKTDGGNKFATVSSPKHQVYESSASTALTIDDDTLKYLINGIDIEHFRSILRPILTERVVGTSGHETVKNYIMQTMNELKWTVENDSFEDYTPDGRKLLFTNIIAMYNPDSPEFLVLACHYDSKISIDGFIGATDSAVPCAMLIYLAENMAEILSKLGKSISLKLIFFDGEEAFLSWSATDSLYGARHLAEVMEQKHYSLDSTRSINELQRMRLFVLLDLLGAPSPQFYSYFKNTNKWYSSLVLIEKRLRSKGLLKDDVDSGFEIVYFNDQTLYSARIDDDHKPFLKKGVQILHIIPSPFPDVWHRNTDNESAVNYNTVFNLLGIFKIFITQYLASFN